MCNVALVLTEWCISVLPIWYVPFVLWSSLVTDVWPEKLNVCSDSTVGNDHSWYLFNVSSSKYFFCSRPFSAVLVHVLEAVHSNSVSVLAVETAA